MTKSLDLFTTWEDYTKKQIVGYTLRDGTDVCAFKFSPSGLQSVASRDHMTELLVSGWEITAIHYIEKP